MKKTLEVLVVAVILLSASPLMAQICHALSPTSDPDGHTKWKLNSGTSEISELSLDQIIVAVALATNTWNDNANGRTFEFAGTTTRESLPEYAAECNAAGIDYDLVTIVSCSVTSGASVNAAASTRGRCKINGKPTHYQILVFGRSGLDCANDQSWGLEIRAHRMI
jgi:hypothetical protein